MAYKASFVDLEHPVGEIMIMQLISMAETNCQRR